MNVEVRTGAIALIIAINAKTIKAITFNLRLKNRETAVLKKLLEASRLVLGIAPLGAAVVGSISSDVLRVITLTF